MTDVLTMFRPAPMCVDSGALANDDAVTDFERFATALAPVYRLERELGRGGMARSVAREWQRHEPRLRGVRVQTDAYIAAVRGDVDAVAEQLRSLAAAEQRGEVGYEQSVVNATTLLRTRGGKPDAGDSIVNAVLAAGGARTAAGVSDAVSRSDLLIAAQRWSDAWVSLDSLSATLDSLQRGGSRWPRYFLVSHIRLQTWRAVVLLHLQRAAEALAIAAHRGEFDRAIALLQKAIKNGATGFLDFRAYPSIEADPLFLPLRDDPRFKALAKPDPIDG